MRFKKLQIQGFKSFGEPTEVVFEPGVTAVVGPNGCGKSNIADAIKWVLGEQSARELRGGRMEDLIFNGSDRRDPVNYAEVSLTLDNSEKKLDVDYAEVVISRRLFRSGESLYLLNGTVVRLKDVHDLLMGTGIGTSAYSLFEQGRIEQIISARPEERRAVFEEAAGITKYKSQKREAMRKLDETEANLLRVSDVIAEVKRQIQALERQVRRAKNYQLQFDELKTLETRLGRHDLESITTQTSQKESALADIRRQTTDLESQLGGQEKRLEEARAAVSAADVTLNEARAALLSVRHGQENLRHRLEMTRERIAEAVSRGAQLLQDAAAAEEQLAKLRQQLAEIAELVAQAETERQGKQQELAGSQQRLDGCALQIDAAEKEITQTQDNLLEETNSHVHLKNQAHQVHQELTHLDARLNRLKMEGTKVAVEKTEAETLEKSLGDSLALSRDAIEVALQERATAQRALSERETGLEAAQRKVAAIEQEKTRVNSQLDLFKGLLATHEGYSSGVKALLTAIDTGRLAKDGINGVLAELIQVGEADAPAVDASLGPWGEAVVVDSMEDAERCRLFLEETKGGRVIFLIRNAVPEAADTPRPIAINGAVPLLDKIGVSPDLEPLLRIVLGYIYFVESREKAREFLQVRSEQTFLRVVTPAGELFTIISSMLGDIPSEEVLIVGRKSRLQSLEVASAQIDRQLEGAKGELTQAQTEHQAGEQVLSVLENSYQEKAQELHRVEATHESAQVNLSKLDQEQNVLAIEQTEVERELAEVAARHQAVQQQLEEKERQLAALQESVRESQQKIAAAAKEREEISVQLATVRAELATFDQITASRRESLRVLEQGVQTSESQLNSFREESARLESARGQWDLACVELDGSLKSLEQQELEASGRVSEQEGRRTQALEEAIFQEKQWVSLGKQMESLQSQLHQLDLEIAQLLFQREGVVSRLAQMYQVNLGELPPEESAGDAGRTPETEEMPLDQAKARVEELSQKLQRMGPVNLASIDEEKELQTRYEYLVTQQADLAKAKEDLHEAITKINRTTRTMFRETFLAIQKEFQFTFKQLFGGGEARLVLMDEEDVLESGIEIIARPPGKPVQAISLLSGGEKALTTIALLFAIFRVKPSPFCLLDEIDAPLDETNVGRFTGALKEFLKDSQFIIITHNKKTMTMADVMYGITMEESGVSRVVSVKFKKKEAPEEGVVSAPLQVPDNGAKPQSE